MGQKCSACGVPWKSHLGVQGTCAEVQQLKSALATKDAALEAALAALQIAVRAGLDGFTPEVEDEIIANHATCNQIRTALAAGKE